MGEFHTKTKTAWTTDKSESSFYSDFKYVGKFESKIPDKSFHQVIFPVLFLAQIFGLFPISGISGQKASDLKFSFLNPRIFLSLFMFVVEVLMVLVTLYWMLKFKLEFGKIAAVVFYGSNVVALYLFCALARNWPKLMLNWEIIESKIPTNKTIKEKALLGRRIKMLTTIIMLLSIIEHGLSIVSRVYTAYKCVGLSSSLKAYFLGAMSQFFYVMEYHVILGFCIQIMNLYCTFSWNFMDLFIMVISYGISSRFKQVNKSMELVRGQRVPESFWTSHRVHYNNLCDLLSTIDKKLGSLILLSFSNNLYFICIQLLNGLSPGDEDTTINDVYFWFSLIYLIGRTLAVCMFSSNVYDESRKPIPILQSVPNESYYPEVKRFLNQVINDKIALSGKNFFHITRGLILTIAGTIVTYELVLVQFNDSSDVAVKETNKNCT